MTVLRGNIFLDSVGALRPGQVEWNSVGQIVSIEETPQREYYHNILPGFIDEHVHGIAGDDVMDRDPERFQRIGARLAAHGVTSYLATTLTAAFPHIRRVVEEAATSAPPAKSGARLLGMHLEGPFIDRLAKGAQPLEEVAEANLEAVQTLIGDNHDGWIRLITWAPNLPHSQPAIVWLTTHGVRVNLGHSLATYEEGRAGVASGATGLTHFFNAMSPLRHREPGLVGLGLLDKRLWCELIADGIHVRPEVIRYVMETMGERVVLITDAMAAADMGPGTFALGGYPVTVSDGAARLADGTLAGSVLTMDHALRNLMQWGVPLGSIVRGLSTNPATRLGLSNCGRLVVGARADIVVMDAAFQVMRTYRNGEPVYSALAP